MAVLLKIPQVGERKDQFERLILEGRSKKEIMKIMGVFAGDVHKYVRYFATPEIGKKLLENGRGA